jgi:hypothetical protein
VYTTTLPEGMIGEDRQWKVKMKFNSSVLPSGKYLSSTVSVDEFEEGVEKYSPPVAGNQKNCEFMLCSKGRFRIIREFCTRVYHCTVRVKFFTPLCEINQKCRLLYYKYGYNFYTISVKRQTHNLRIPKYVNLLTFGMS